MASLFLQCYNNFPSWSPSQYDNYLHLFDLEIVPIDWWRKHLDNIEMHLNKHEKGIKHNNTYTLFNILYYDHKIDKNKYKNENRSVQSITLGVSCPIFFSVDTWNFEKIHILAAPQYKPRADFHKIKVAAYFPNFTVYTQKIFMNNNFKKNIESIYNVLACGYFR